MPELYVEALLEEHGLCKRPQATMQTREEFYSQRFPNWHLNCAGNLKFPEDVETWMQAHDHLQSTMDEWECAYEASFCRAQKKAIRAQQLLDSERKRF